MARRTRASARKREAAETPLSLAPRRLLLDTHVWLWWQANDRHLGPRARSVIATAADVYFSAASAWEIAIKVSIGKLTLPPSADIGAELERDGFQPLAVDIAHAEIVRTLAPLHRDPFDRLLVAQAKAEALTVVTVDPRFAAYGIAVLDARE